MFCKISGERLQDHWSSGLLFEHIFVWFSYLDSIIRHLFFLMSLTATVYQSYLTYQKL